MIERPVGRVYLVGAGPGDAGLLTVRGAELLARAELVVYDGLVNPALLRLAPATAETVAVGRHEGVRVLSQASVNQLLVEAAAAGRTVVRLKGGDSYVFGRGAEEAAELAAAGIPFEVVPGVSSFHAVPAYAGIPLTSPDGASPPQFVVFSGQEDPAKPGSILDWPGLARGPGTRVILMGMERLPEITRQLEAHGVPRDEPVAVIRWGTTLRQDTLVGTLADIADQVAGQGFGAPAVIVVGPTARRAPDLAWFENRPLFRRRIVVTRTRDDAGPLARSLEELGAEVWELPVIRRAAPEDPEPARAAAEQAAAYDWIVFTSAAGVSAFFERLLATHGDLRSLGQTRLAAVGPATAARIRELHLRVDAVPARHVGREIARAMQDQGDLRDLRVLLARARIAGSDLVAELERLGALVDDVAFYRTVAEDLDQGEPRETVARLLAEGADWITFTSPSTVEHAHARLDLPGLRGRHSRLRFASIGPETSRALATLGLPAHAEASPHTAEGLVAALRRSIA
jgi:uroporphyrinogen III methyltransferase/synthase